MTLSTLQNNAQKRAEILVQTLLQSKAKKRAKGEPALHPILPRGRVNAGLWRSKANEMLAENISTGDAAMLASLLSFDFVEDAKIRWPW